jgi:hypothetical protein
MIEVLRGRRRQRAVIGERNVRFAVAGAIAQHDIGEVGNAINDVAAVEALLG